MSYLIKVFFSLLDLELFIEFGRLCQKDVEKCEEKLPLGCSKVTLSLNFFLRGTPATFIKFLR